MSLLTKLATFAATLALASTAYSANVTLTFIGTATTNSYGYTNGQNVSFSFVLNDTDMTVASLDPNFIEFMDESLSTNTDIWSSVSGTGLTGTWTRPSTSNEDPYSRMTYYSSGRLRVMAAADFSNIGLSAGGTTLSYINFDVELSGFSPTDFASTDNPSEYLSDYLGTYSVDNGYSAAFVSGNNIFDFSQVVISAVPEPSESAVAAGLGVFALVALRRLRKRA